MFGLFCWSLFGSFNIEEVTGQKCGPWTVVPCIMHDVTRTIDILDKYRFYAVSIAGLLLVLSLVAPYIISRYDDRKAG